MAFVCTEARTCANSRFLKITGVLLLAILTFTAPPLKAHAAQATLNWDASTSSGVTGYKLYYGTASGSYSQSMDVGNATSYTVSGLSDGQKYYFAAKAYNSTGNQSAYSNETSYTTAALPAPTTTYTISASAGTGGTISPTGSVAVSQGLNQSFTIAPSTGYKIAGVMVDGASKGAVTSYTFSNVTANHTIAASFTTASTASYTITATAGANGSISPSGTTTVSSGGTKIYTITPATGYNIAGVTVDGVSKGAVSSYTFSNVTANHTISATFAASSSTSITSSTVWQNISIASQAGVFTASFDVIPNANNIDGLTVLSAVPAQAFADGATTVRFNTSGNIDARNGSTYAADVVVPYTAGNTYHVRMSVNVPNKVYDVYVTPPGGTEIHLATGYAFRTEQATVSVLNNLGVFADIGSYQLKNFTIAQTAPTATYSISASAGTGGSISPSGTQTVNYGGSKSYTITPSSRYTISTVTVDGVSVGAVSSYTFSNVTANHTIKATFTRKRW